jgi:hypothetical protein
MQSGLQIQIDTQAAASANPAITISIQQIAAGIVAQTISTTQVAISSAPVVPPPTPADIWLASFPRDPDGYTLFPVPANAIILGTEPGDAPDLKTAQQAAQANQSNAVLLRRGQTYSAAQINDLWRLSGASPATPSILGCTGDLSLPRPIINGMLQVCDAKLVSQNMAIFGLDFYDPSADPSSPKYAKAISQYEAGIRFVDSQPGSHYAWIEDCRFRFLQGGLEVQELSATSFQTFIVRRCTIDHNYGQRWGVYFNFVRDVIIEDCFADHNGWDEPLAGTTAGLAPKSDLSHNLYIQSWPLTDKNDPQFRVRNLFSSRAAADGIEQRPGGTLDTAYLFANPIAGFLGQRPSRISNIIIDGGSGQFDLSCGTNGPRGQGISSNVCPTAEFTNIIATAKPDPVNAQFAFYVQTSSTGSDPNAATQATFNQLIAHNWTPAPGQNLVQIDPAPSPTIAYTNCDLPGITAPGILPTPAYVDPTRCLTKYATTLGAANVDGSPPITDAKTFLAAAALNRRGKYDSRLTAPAAQSYVAAGFVKV